MPMDLTERLRHLQRLKERAARSEKIAKERKERFKEFELDTFAYMERNGLDGVTAGGFRFEPRSTTLSTVYDLDAFEGWLREQGLDEEFLRAEPRKQRLNELVRERLDNQQEFPPGVQAYAREYISITER